MTRPLARPLAQGALLGACPKCGARTLFKSVIGFAHTCSQCGLDFDQFDVGDAAAPFLIFLVGTVVVVGAIWLELSRSPPWWVHALIWPALTLVLTLAMLRFAKAMLVALEYKNEAKLGTLE